MDLEKQLKVLQDAQGDPAKLALATVDLAYADLPDSERALLRGALEVAAIPHWCDEAILAALLEIPKHESAGRLARLRKLSVVEPFPARGSDAVNVHEATRLVLRDRMASKEQGRFRVLSRRAAACFAEDHMPAGRIEWIYHLLCGNPETGPDELERLDRDWGSTARPEDRYALVAALSELEHRQLVEGRARVSVLLLEAGNRVSRGEFAELAEAAEEILGLAKSVDEATAEGEAQCLLGDVFQAQGKLGEAQAAFEQFLAISRRLAEQDPSNAGGQRDLAVAHSRVGDVFQAQQKLGEAQAAFEHSLAICQPLAEQDPSNAGGQRELAVAHSRVGDVFQARGKLGEAQWAFVHDLAISQRLAEQDPSNARWQRELAVAYGRLGGVLETQGKLSEALAAYGHFWSIFQRLAEQDPSNAGWWRQDLLVALGIRFGRVFQTQGELEEAVRPYEEAIRGYERLTDIAPDFAKWRQDKE